MEREYGRRTMKGEIPIEGSGVGEWAGEGAGDFRIYSPLPSAQSLSEVEGIMVEVTDSLTALALQEAGQAIVPPAASATSTTPAQQVPTCAVPTSHFQPGMPIAVAQIVATTAPAAVHKPTTRRRRRS